MSFYNTQEFLYINTSRRLPHTVIPYDVDDSGKTFAPNMLWMTAITCPGLRDTQTYACGM